MTDGVSFTSTEALVIAVVGFGSALLGAALGSLTAWWLERRREKREHTIAKAAVVLELALTSGALQAAAIDRQIRRSELTTTYWQRFGPELITFLPDYLVKAMYVLLEDGFDSVRHAHAQMKRGIHPAYWPAAQTLMLSWAYHADRINQMISEYSKTKKIVLPAGPDEEKFLRVLEEAQRYALEKVKSHGLPTDVQLAVPDDADLSLPPEMQPDSGKHIEFRKVDPTGMIVPTADGTKEGTTT